MARESSKQQEVPKLAKIDTDMIVLDPDFWFRKRYQEIGEAAGELPTVIEYINESLQRAMIATSEAKRDVDRIEAETYIRLRKDWSTVYAEKMTEKALEMAIAMDQTLADARHNLSVLKSYVSRLQNMQDNLRMKLDSMRTVEATRRKLLQDDPD
jgi:hypothetical protein